MCSKMPKKKKQIVLSRDRNEAAAASPHTRTGGAHRKIFRFSDDTSIPTPIRPQIFFTDKRVALDGAERYFSMNDFVPANTDPTGAPRPLLKQNVTESQCFTMRLTGTPRLEAALNTLAPSMCKGTSISLANSPN